MSEYETFSLEQAVDFTGAPSIDWLSRRITSGETPAVLSGNSWRMTRADMAVLVDQMRAAGAARIAELAARTGRQNTPDETPVTAPAAANRAGLSARGAARIAKRQNA